MADVVAVRSSSIWAVPLTPGLPVACLFVLFVTACPLKEAAALPTRSCSRAADSSDDAV